MTISPSSPTLSSFCRSRWSRSGRLSVSAATQVRRQRIEGQEISVQRSPHNLAVLDAQKVLRLVDLLESSDDVQDVYFNADIPEEAYEAEA